MLIMFFYRMSRRFGKHRFLRRFFKQLNYSINSIDISPEAEIGKNFRLHHNGIGTVIGGCKIGDNVHIYHNVTIGERKGTLEHHGLATIEDNVVIYPGAIILGKVTIGQNSIIGAGTLVNKNVPPNSTAYNDRRLVIKKDKHSKDGSNHH